MRVETRRVLAEGVWQVVFVVFLAYAMMPLKTWVAALFGLFLPVVHVVVAAIFAKEFPSLTWQQVRFRRKNCIYFSRHSFLTRGFLITHNDAPQSVGLLWTSDQSVAETST